MEDFHITAAHTLVAKKKEAGKESRKLSADLEWMLCSKSLSESLIMLNYISKAGNVNLQFYTYIS